MDSSSGGRTYSRNQFETETLAKILIIDDDQWIQKVFQQILEGEGHETITANNGQEGLDIYKQESDSIDLVLTDMVMPVKDGLKFIMELEKEFGEVKVIAISGGGVIEPERYLSLAESIGTSRTLKKPVKKQELITAVNEVLSVK